MNSEQYRTNMGPPHDMRYLQLDIHIHIHTLGYLHNVFRFPCCKLENQLSKIITFASSK